jgi:hypothetical protein
LPDIPPPETPSRTGLSLLEALIAGADRQLWATYCRLAAELDGHPVVAPIHAPGSVEWQMQQDREPAAAEPDLAAEAEAAGRARLCRRGAAVPFVGAVSPFGAAEGDRFDAFLAGHRGPPALLAQIGAIEQQLVDGFEVAFRNGGLGATGFRGGAAVEVAADWFGWARLDFARNAMVPPDGMELAGIVVSLGRGPAPPQSVPVPGRNRERPAQAMLRQALVALWQRGAFGVGTGNERVLALALRELGLSAADPPYGFKSAETVRKLRKALKMSL